jgi:hypothetical protein
MGRECEAELSTIDQPDPFNKYLAHYYSKLIDGAWGNAFFLSFSFCLLAFYLCYFFHKNRGRHRPGRDGAIMGLDGAVEGDGELKMEARPMDGGLMI